MRELFCGILGAVVLLALLSSCDGNHYGRFSSFRHPAQFASDNGVNVNCADSDECDVNVTSPPPAEHHRHHVTHVASHPRTEQCDD